MARKVDTDKVIQGIGAAAALVTALGALWDRIATVWRKKEDKKDGDKIEKSN